MVIIFFQHFLPLSKFCPVLSSFFQFCPDKTGRNRFLPFFSGCPGRNKFLPEETQPCFNLSMKSPKWQLFCTGFNELTHCGLVTPYGDRDLGQHWLRYYGRLVAWRHQAITWTNVDLSSVRSSCIHQMAISQEIHQSSMTKINMKLLI